MSNIITIAQLQSLLSLLPEYIVDTDYTVRPTRATVVYDSGITLYPDPTS